MIYLSIAAAVALALMFSALPIAAGLLAAGVTRRVVKRKS